MIREALQFSISWLLGLGDPGTVVEITGWHWYAAMPLEGGLLAVLVIAGVAAAALNLLPRNSLPLRARVAVIVIRLVAFGLLILLLCQLEAHVMVVRALPPNVAIVTDASGSMAVEDVRGMSRFAAAREFSTELVKNMGESRGIAADSYPRYTLNWKLQPEASTTGPVGMTHLMDGLGQLIQHEHDVQGVVLLTDGNDTTGNNGASVAPLFAARNVPVYPVVFGKTEAAQMASVRITGACDYVRLGDELYLQAELAARVSKEQAVRARLFIGDSKNPLAVQESIRLAKETTPISFAVTPDKPGRFTYRIVVDGVRESVTTKLLEAAHTVDVIDQRIRVLYVDIPRGERKILGHWLARDPGVDLATLLMLPKGGWYAQGVMRHKNAGTGLPDRETDLYKYDVIMLGDIPRSYFRSGDPSETKLQWLVDFVKRRGGGLVTLGGRAVYAAGQYDGSPLAAILPFTIVRTRDAQIPGKFRAVPTPAGFSHLLMMLERDPEANRNAWLELPTLEGCNRVGGIRPGAELLAVCSIEGEQTPAVACLSVGKGRVLALTVDTTWRWEMMRPRDDTAAGTSEGTDYFRRFWGNAVRYLAPDPRLNPERPQINRQSADAAVGQTVSLSTRLVDQAFRPIRKADLVIRVTSPSGRTVRMFPCDSMSNPGVYEYDVTLTEQGKWRIEAIHRQAQVEASIAKATAALAEAKASGDKAAILRTEQELAAAKAQIAVEEIRAGESREELEDPRARPEAMEAFARMTGGRSFRPEAADALLRELRPATHVVPRSYAVALWNRPAVLALFIALVAADCLIRKRRGMV